MNNCANCGRVYKYKWDKYICEDGRPVDYYGTCDRYHRKALGEKEIFEKIEASLDRMKEFQEGTYEVIKRAPLGTNYRLLRCQK